MAKVWEATEREIEAAFAACEELLPGSVQRRAVVLKNLSKALSGHAWSFELKPEEELWSQSRSPCCAILTSGALRVHHKHAYQGARHNDNSHAGTLLATSFFGVSALAGRPHTAEVIAWRTASGLFLEASTMITQFMSERNLFQGLVNNLRGVIGRLADDVTLLRELGPELRARHAIHELAPRVREISVQDLAARSSVSEPTARKVLQSAARETKALRRLGVTGYYAIDNAVVLQGWCVEKPHRETQGYVAQRARLSRSLKTRAEGRSRSMPLGRWPEIRKNVSCGMHLWSDARVPASQCARFLRVVILERHEELYQRRDRGRSTGALHR